MDPTAERVLPALGLGSLQPSSRLMSAAGSGLLLARPLLVAPRPASKGRREGREGGARRHRGGRGGGGGGVNGAAAAAV